MSSSTQDKILAATRGTKTGAIIACAFDAERDALPRFVGKAMMTSDGFIMCNFIDQEGFGHLGAFVGSHADYVENLRRVASHCALTPDERAYFSAIMSAWCPINKERRVS